MRFSFKKIFSMQEKEELTPDESAEITMTDSTNVTEEQAEGSTEQLVTDETTELKKQVEEARNKYLYLVADFENYKRHAARERIELMQTAGKDILSALLPILDDFDRAQKNSAMTEGTTLIHHKLINTLRGKGLVSLEVKPGDNFNPDQQEAIVDVPAPSEELKGKIVDIIEPGYQLGDRIIRFAKVVVGK
jgi:molecular chaperone GrpE